MIQSFAWEIGSYKCLNPHKVAGAKTRIKCDRGPYPGNARLLLKAADATAVLSSATPLDINIKEYERTGDTWTLTTTHTFKNYFPKRSRVPGGINQGVVELYLEDARWKLAETHVRKRYNIVKNTSATDPSQRYDAGSTISGTPWTYSQILADLFGAAPTAPAVTISDTVMPDNIVFDCSLSEAIEQLLACRGLAYCYNPFTGTATAQALATPSTPTAINSAIAAKRLIKNHNSGTSAFSSTVAVTVAPWQATSLGSEVKIINPPSSATSGSAKHVFVPHYAANTTGVSTIAAAWYRCLQSPLDGTFQGIVQQPPSNAITHCCWWHSKASTRSRFQTKLQRELPWPVQPIGLSSNGGSASLVRFKLTEPLTPNGTADAEIESSGLDDGTEIQVTDWAGNSALTNQRGIAWKDGATYWVTELLAASGSNSIAFVLTADASWLAFNTVQTVTANIWNTSGLPGPAITVKIIGQSRAKAGCRGVATEINGELIVTEIQQPSLRMRATTASQLNPTDTTKSVTLSEVLTPFPFDVSPLTNYPSNPLLEVDNPKSLFGFAGAKVDLTYDASTDRYFIDSIQKHAWRIKGTLEDEMLPSDSEIKLEYVTGLDGVLNESIVTDGFVMAKNTHHWNGVSGATARAEYNWDLGQWELYQIDCEEDPPEEE